MVRLWLAMISAFVCASALIAAPSEESPPANPFAGLSTNLSGDISIATLRSASDQGDPVAKAVLGYGLLQSKRKQDVEEGLRLFQQAADLGFDHAMAELGNTKA